MIKTEAVCIITHSEKKIILKIFFLISNRITSTISNLHIVIMLHGQYNYIIKTFIFGSYERELLISFYYNPC